MARRRLALAGFELTSESERIDSLATTLLADLREARMLQVSTLLDTFDRPVRELAREHGLNLRLAVRGGEVRLDKRVLEALKEPLVHLLRNTVAHGIESPEQRVAAGKPPMATVTISAEQRGNRVLLSVRDDGRGIEAARVRAAAQRDGFLDEAGARALTSEALHELLFRPGFSTREVASQVAGRGMGLAAVREAVERLHGEVALESEAGAGACFTLSVPFTVAATRGLLVSAGRELFALPVASIERVARVSAAEVTLVQGLPTVEVNGEPVRLLGLAEAAGRPAGALGERPFHSVVIASGRRRLALAVDEVVGELEIISKDLPGPLSGIDLLAGATLLEDGRVVPVLNAEGLLREAAGRAPLEERAQKARQTRVLVVDDSATTRMLMSSELEAAGFQVTCASDGSRALELLEARGADAIVSDVDMPNLDGFELTRAVRANPALAWLPVILVTSKDGPSDKSRGAEVGADAYIVKKDFARTNLVEMLARLVKRRGLA